MKIKGLLYTLFHQPAWAYIVGIFITMNLAPSMASLLGGGKGLLFFSILGLLLFRDKELRMSAGRAIELTLRENRWLLYCLVPYYIMVVVSWIHSPYEVKYEDIGFIWKTHLGNIVSLFIAMAISRNPKWLRFFVVFALPFVLRYCVLFSSVLQVLGGEARDYLRDPSVGGLGASGNWQVIAMYSVVLLGCVFAEKNWVFKCLGILCVLYIDKCILRAGYATPVALLLIGYMVFSCAFFFYGKKTRYSGMLKVLIIVGGIVGSGLAFYKIGAQDEDSAISRSVTQRFKKLAENPLGGGYAGEGEGTEGSRMAFMAVGWNSFLESPLFGKGGPTPCIRGIYASAGHHSIVDYLGHFGLLGGGAYILFVLICLRISIRRYRLTKTWLDAGALGVMIMFFMGGVVNPCWMAGPMSLMLLFCTPFNNRNLWREYKFGLRRVGDGERYASPYVGYRWRRY